MLRGIHVNFTGNPMSAMANSVGSGEMPKNSKLDFLMQFVGMCEI
jgi:hypothetical protein